MKYPEFEKIMSTIRVSRYFIATAHNSKKAMTLYRKNLKLSQELFTVISCFEVALRNAIDKLYIVMHGADWLRSAATQGGIFDNYNCRHSRLVILDAINKLSNHYTHAKLVALLDFGFWRYLFAQPQFHAAGQILLQIFPEKPRSTPSIQYNHTYVFNQLSRINILRNRIAHHEPICFTPGQPVKDTTYTRQHYALILQLFKWMSIDEDSLLYGLDHVDAICNEIDAF